ncbi:eukaryotic translation initiation factor 4 gamma 3-like isoform X2 [Mercenaria mercenaria]|uniref:eukaryotic translation initiation factor 4 gamma 3-like isoform X2 n=1 Tax=Mercenaria mercenaria TaxID=6596 RepID=UPI00234F81D5|nr:eukaryotic translation initiation factor 4 gamma 3-like isoform X2 [Mercenaria mercenaria]
MKTAEIAQSTGLLTKTFATTYSAGHPMKIVATAQATGISTKTVATTKSTGLPMKTAVISQSTGLPTKTVATTQSTGLSMKTVAITQSTGLPTKTDEITQSTGLSMKTDATTQSTGLSTKTVAISQSTTLPMKSVTTQLYRFLVKENADSATVIEWVENNVDETVRLKPKFIRYLMTNSCKSAMKDENGKAILDVDQLVARRDLLLKVFNHQTELELQALQAVQSFITKLGYPKDVLLGIFQTLYDVKVISKDAFFQVNIIGVL